jgi:hypothetical protein
MGYAQATSEQLLNHLVELYGRITARELDKNFVRIATPWNPGTFSPMAPTAKVTVEGNDPISDATYVRIVVKI